MQSSPLVRRPSYSIPPSDLPDSDQTRVYRVVTLDDDELVCDLYGAALVKRGCEVKCISQLSALERLISTRFYDAVLTDHYLKDHTADDVLELVMKLSPFTKVFVMTGYEKIDLAVRLMEQGATSFIPKSLGPAAGADRISQHLEASSPLPTAQSDFGIIGNSKAISEIHSKIDLIKDTKAHVLISGESGTGKELVARALHMSSIRQKERFEAINCGAIPETLLESELFGHKRGAFTDAKTNKRGLFEVCQDGTLFLDEIGDMPISLQVKILRVLQDREVRPIGSDQSFKINTRIVAASNRNLADEVSKGTFREDLYYRLSVLDLHVPPLRERSQDIEILFHRFLHEFSEQNEKPMQAPAHDIMRKLKTWHWPGNVRELRNAVERAVILSTDGEIHCEHLFQRTEDIPRPTDTRRDDEDHQSYPYPFHEAKIGFEKSYLHQLLTKADGNIAEASRLSGKTRVEIYRLIDRNKISLSNYRR